MEILALVTFFCLFDKPMATQFFKYSFLFSKEDNNMSSWKKKLDVVESFFENHERRPSNKSKNVNEKTLAHWMETQLENRANHQYSMASAEICNVWDTFKTKYNEYFRSNAMIWYGNLEEVRLFIEKNQKRPYERSKVKKENELGKWILRQLKNRLKNRRNMVREEIRDIWDAFKIKYIEYLRSYRENWLYMINKVKLHVMIHKRRPLFYANDEKEKALDSWLLSQSGRREKKRQLMLCAEIRDIWDAFDKMSEETMRIWSLTINHCQEKKQQIIASERISDIWITFSKMLDAIKQ